MPLRLPWILTLLTAGALTASAQELPLQDAEGLRAVARDRQCAGSVVSRMLSQRSALALDEKHGFNLARTLRTQDGKLVHRLQHTFQGLPVWGSESIVTTDLEGNPQGEPLHQIRRAAAIDVVPSLKAHEALMRTTPDISARWSGATREFAEAPKSTLVVVPITRQVRVAGAENKAEHELNALDLQDVVDRYALAYHVQVRQQPSKGRPVHLDSLVDAQTGEVLAQWDALQQAPATITGRTLYSGNVSLTADTISNGYRLLDPTRATNANFYITNYNNTNVLTTTSSTVGDGTKSNTLTAAADVLWGLSSVYDMLLNCYNWKGIDNYNKGIRAQVHLNEDNAYFDGNASLIFGDGVSMFNPLVAVDVVSHELGHAVCAATAGLVYSGESGGLNESNSDIIGEMSEFYSRGGKTGSTIPDNTGDWVTGANVGKNGPLRYFTKPSLDGGSPDAWSSTLKNLDVHYSSGPNNRMFYFLAMGSTASGNTSSSYLKYGPIAGLGIQKAGAIWLKALTTKMTSGTTYATALTACKAAAEDLYGVGSRESKTVQRAYAAINVGTDVQIDGTTTPLAFSTQPANVSVAPGGTATFNVAVTGGTAPYKYQWYKNGAALSGATSASYTFTAQAADNNAKFKAVVTDSASPAATLTSTEATLTVGSTPSTDLVKNGSFEQGATSWTGDTGVIGNWSANTPAQQAYDGVNCAYLGGNGKTATENLAQDITIPATATSATLSFQLHIDTAETGTTVYDKLAVQVRNSAGTVLKTLATYSNANAGAGYQARTFDLSAYKGQTVRLQFVMTEDAYLQTSFVIDKVSVVTK